MSNLSFSVLKSRPFRFLLMARMLVMMAMQAQGVVVGWQVYSLTKSPFLLGLVGLTEALPAIACALFAGHIVDRSNPKRVLLLCLAALSVNTFALLLLGGGIIPLDKSVLLPAMFAAIFVSGLARSFSMPSAFAVQCDIVPKHDIPAAMAWRGSTMQFAIIAGPAMAGLVYGGYGALAAWMIPMTLIAAGFLFAAAIEFSYAPKPSEGKEPALQSMKAGLDFVLKHPVLLSVMSLDMFAVLFGGAVAMLPAYADQVLHVGAQGLGILRAAPAIGGVTVALIMALRPMKSVSAKRLLWAVAGFGACMIGFGLNHIFALSLIFLALSGGFDSISVVMRGTLMQILTPDSMRGRVSSINSMFIISSNEIGAFESGVAARALGLVPSVVFGGCATLAVVAATAFFSPTFRKTVVQADASVN
jgi:MFS family permease